MNVMRYAAFFIVPSVLLIQLEPLWVHIGNHVSVSLTFQNVYFAVQFSNLMECVRITIYFTVARIVIRIFRQIHGLFSKICPRMKSGMLLIQFEQSNKFVMLVLLNCRERHKSFFVLWLGVGINYVVFSFLHVTYENIKMASILL
jgi:hypothetical protein